MSRYQPKPEPTPLERSPAALGYPRSAKGEYAAWQNGAYFSTSQQEWHKALDWFVGVDAQFGIIELETGEWLADGWVHAERYLDRRTALAAAAADCIRKVTSAATPYTNCGTTFTPRVTIKFANAVIQWAADEAGIPAPLMDEPARAPSLGLADPALACSISAAATTPEEADNARDGNGRTAPAVQLSLLGSLGLEPRERGAGIHGQPVVQRRARHTAAHHGLAPNAGRVPPGEPTSTAPGGLVP